MKKLPYLESLRGIAALVVVISHFVVAFYPALFWGQSGYVHMRNGLELAVAASPLHVLYNGTFSVAIFFVLSGFVLTYQFFRDRQTGISLGPIAMKRYTRLLIPVLFSILLSFVFLRFGWYANQPAAELSRSDWLASYWTFNADLPTALYEAFIGAFFTNQTTYNSVLWTMSYELFGSLIVYTCVAVFGRHPKRHWFYLLAVLIFRRSYYLAFIVGMMLSDITTRERSLFRDIRHKGYYIALLATGLFLGSLPSAIPLEGTLYSGLGRIAAPRTWYIIGASLVMTALLNSRRLQRLLSQSPFVFLGRISFSLYILHQLILGTMTSMLFLLFVRSGSYHVAVLGACTVSLLILLFLSNYTYRFVDAQGISLSQAVHRSILGVGETMSRNLCRSVPRGSFVHRLACILLHPGQPPSGFAPKNTA